MTTLERIDWLHSIPLKDGVVTPGAVSYESLKCIADAVFRGGAAGKSVLDIGAWDGFYAFEAERRGAARVLATDHFCWSGPGVGSRKGFDFAHASLGSKVEALDIDVPSLSPDALGTFDVVLFLGVLYHVEDMLTYLERAAAMTHDLLVIDTETRLNFLPWPAARYFPGAELNNDPTNFWAPNVAWLSAALKEEGFVRLAIAPHPCTVWRRRLNPSRHLIHAWRTEAQGAGAS